MNHLTKIFSRELITRFKLFESAILGPPWPDLQKIHMKIGRFAQKSIFLPYKFFYEIKTKVILRDLLTLCHVKRSDFQNIKWFLSYT